MYINVSGSGIAEQIQSNSDAVFYKENNEGHKWK
jgi:hypothetical protein